MSCWPPGLSLPLTYYNVLGVLVGAFISSLVRGEFQLQTFESARDHARYFFGAI